MEIEDLLGKKTPKFGNFLLSKHQVTNQIAVSSIANRSNLLPVCLAPHEFCHRQNALGIEVGLDLLVKLSIKDGCPSLTSRGHSEDQFMARCQDTCSTAKRNRIHLSAYLYQEVDRAFNRSNQILEQTTKIKNPAEKP